VEPELWRRVEELCHRALELEGSQRVEFLERSCGDDDVLRREVESLLAHEKRAERFIESSAMEAMGKLVADERATNASGENLIGTSVSHYRVVEKRSHRSDNAGRQVGSSRAINTVRCIPSGASAADTTTLVSMTSRSGIITVWICEPL